MPTAKLPAIVTCIFCEAEVDSRESLQSWRRIEVNGRWFYACPREFPLPPASHEEQSRAANHFVLAVLHLARVSRAPSSVAVAAAAGGAR